MHRARRLSVFDKLCWKLIGAVAKNNPDAAINVMGGGDPSNALAAFQGRGTWDPRPRGVSARHSNRG